MREKGHMLFGAAAVCALLVVPVAIAGGGPNASSSAGGSKIVKKLKQQVAALTARVAALEAKPVPSALPPSGAAGGDLTGAYPDPEIAAGAVNSSEIATDAVDSLQLATNSVGPLEVQDPVRSINLPLTSFWNDTDNALMDSTPSTGISPDFGEIDGDLAIIWNRVPATTPPNADTDFVSTNLVVPPDYVSGGTAAVLAEASGHTGNDERLSCGATPNGGTPLLSPGPFISAQELTLYTFVLPGTGALSPGSLLEVSCNVEDSAGFGNANDDVGITAIEFRYNAAQ